MGKSQLESLEERRKRIDKQIEESVERERQQDAELVQLLRRREEVDKVLQNGRSELAAKGQVWGESLKKERASRMKSIYKYPPLNPAFATP